MPREGYKGGVGAYRFDNDYDNTPNYKMDASGYSNQSAGFQ